MEIRVSEKTVKTFEFSGLDEFLVSRRTGDRTMHITRCRLTITSRYGSRPTLCEMLFGTRCLKSGEVDKRRSESFHPVMGPAEFELVERLIVEQKSALGDPDLISLVREQHAALRLDF